MEKITQALKTQVQNIEYSLSLLLEHPHANKNQIPFEISTDLTALEDFDIDLPNDQVLRHHLLFSKMTSFYEAGLLFYLKDQMKQQDLWSLEAAFHKGFYFPLKSVSLDAQLKVPVIKPGEIKKIPCEKITKTLRLPEFHEDGMQAFLIRPTDGFLMIFFSKLAEPWLKIHVEKTHQFLLLQTMEE